MENVLEEMFSEEELGERSPCNNAPLVQMLVKALLSTSPRMYVTAFLLNVRPKGRE